MKTEKLWIGTALSLLVIVPMALVLYQGESGRHQQPEVKSARNSNTIPADRDVPARIDSIREGAAPQWSQKLAQSDDLGLFVRDASIAAEKGDPDAAWLVAETIRKCGLVVSSIRKGGDEQAYLALVTSKFTTPQQTAEFSTTFRRCQALATDPAFADWDQQAGGKMLAKYWETLARNLNSPMAQADAVIQQASSLTFRTSPEETAKTAEQLRNSARQVIKSRDPEALFTLGMRLANADMSKDPTYGFALALAACDLGYDCSGHNGRNPWAACDSTATCTPDRTFRDLAEEMLSAEQYAATHALAEEYKDALGRGMFGDLDKFVALDGSSFKGQ